MIQNNFIKLTLIHRRHRRKWNNLACSVYLSIKIISASAAWHKGSICASHSIAPRSESRHFFSEKLDWSFC